MRPLPRINQIALVSCIVGAAALAGSAAQGFGAASTTATVPAAIANVLPTASATPTVVPIAYYSGTRGYPYNMPPFDLAFYGYAESEFQISGAGNLYGQAERFRSDGIRYVTARCPRTTMASVMTFSPRSLNRSATTRERSSMAWCRNA